jgi:osmoprotectant transport system substrate-binding protein
MTGRALRYTAWTATAMVVLVAACTSDANQEDPVDQKDNGRPRIVIGSFDFAESRILAEAYALVLEDAGYPVERLGSVASREIMEPALEQGFVDFVPEYQGTVLTFLNLGRTTGNWNPQETHELLTLAFGGRGIDVLDYAGAENKNEVVVTQATAARYDLKKISDLRKHAPNLVFGGPPECPARPQCLLGLEETYGLEFKAFQPLDVGGTLTVAALEGEEVDVATLFTTNPEIAAKGFVVLKDDLNLQPSENVVPVVRTQISEIYGEDFAGVVNSVTEHFSTADLRQLNGEVEIEGEVPAEAAREWLLQEGLLQ